MAGASRRPLLPSPRLLYLSLLIILASAYSTPALPIKSKPGLLDKIVYVSEDPAIQRWRSEIGGAGIYPAHYALKALDLLPSRNNAPRHMRGRERRRRRSSIIGDDDPISPLTAVHAVARRNSLEVRRRRKKGKNRDGHDDKGYDDGSWRGDDGDYGAVGTGGTDDDDAQNYDSEKAYQEDSQERASSRYSDDYLAGDADRAGSDAGEDSRYPQTAEDTDTVFRPGRQNSKFKSHDLGEFDTEGDEAEQSWRAPGSSRASGDASEPVSENQSQRQDSDASNDQDLEVKQADLYGQDGGNRIKAPAQTRHFDCKALKTFYDDMGGPEWTDSTGWADSETSEGNLCCRAYGVSCNSLGRVTALDLGQNGLSGSLSPSLFELSYLNRL